MKPSIALKAHRNTIRSIVQAHHASNVRVFGSVLRNEDTEESDLDLLIDPDPKATLFDIGAIRHELQQLLNIPIDVLTPNALPEKLRTQILAEALVI